MRIARSSLALVALAGLAMGGCSARPAVHTDPAPGAYAEAVEVINRTPVPVVVKYYTQGGGPHTLGVVNTAQRETFTVPGAVAGHIFVQTESGARVRENSNLVAIRRYPIDRVTGEQVGVARVVR